MRWRLRYVLNNGKVRKRVYRGRDGLMMAVRNLPRLVVDYRYGRGKLRW